ncbi:hypothetical protein PC116_g24005 [Phytophthora cactorum]|uniref:Uncharacterized protein n=1 Tax=Phytophthora cactorum TaxID=29920 RepID=A0A8T1JUF1_9STRA|nr:hypothetical protein PC115_g20002 [Phytophthora cactorum]KAG3046726.1 hypothetical protein PC121_g20503 [Phytophthora cactorum]KAG4039699.1 hypothetical protein PC123_g24753 [Phytophthora cactorum]KAG4227607.1 hypothetical protein PC116_g24005 [Phytophthora cactorum]
MYLAAVSVADVPSPGAASPPGSASGEPGAANAASSDPTNVESDNDDASVRGQTSTPTPENPEEGGEDENDLDVTITAVDEEADELVARRERRRAWRI